MPKTPTGAKRPADVTQNAVLVMKIATGEVEEVQSPKARAGSLGGKLGGKSRAQSLTQDERSTAAKKAAKARWSK
jgi:hypothetical protein